MTDERRRSHFEQLTASERRELLSLGREIQLAPGDILFHEGDTSTSFYVILEGDLRIEKRVGGQSILLSIEGVGSFIGEIAMLTGRPRSATARAARACLLREFQASAIDGLNDSPLIRLLLGTIVSRLHDTETRVSQQEKLSALGKIAAGLAHELNNPAAAALRAARGIPDAAAAMQSCLLQVASHGLDAEAIDTLTALQEETRAHLASTKQLTPLVQSEREEALIAWMDAHSIYDGWQIAPALVAGGITTQRLDALVDVFGSALGDVLRWLDGFLNVNSLAQSAANGTMRIAALVTEVKAYTLMDQSPLQTVDLHDGIDNTLTILAHRLGEVEVVRAYAETLPRVTLHAGEINEVWTAVIENAIDAMRGIGTLTIRTFHVGDQVQVEIGDTGEGIAPEHLSRIFEPFFTTKPMSTGTGLDIVRRIIDRHQGSIRCVSHPGDTRFTVLLPLNGVVT